MKKTNKTAGKTATESVGVTETQNRIERLEEEVAMLSRILKSEIVRNQESDEKIGKVLRNLMKKEVAA